jgi:hypothetical protein
MIFPVASGTPAGFFVVVSQLERRSFEGSGTEAAKSESQIVFQH